jgi:hypothetical protein
MRLAQENVQDASAHRLEIEPAIRVFDGQALLFGGKE